MKNRTPKRAAIDRAAKPFRDELRDSQERCNYCGRDRRALECHEILRGGGYRARTQKERCNILVLCRDCHDKMGGKSWAWQLAILYLSRPSDFDLPRFWLLADRRTPDQSEVDSEISKLLGGKK